uniref:Tetraspanin n=1 Tax=Leptobrachium leishanense TaxID=445787 RepID=A0A8C5LNA4_9ANUR
MRQAASGFLGYVAYKLYHEYQQYKEFLDPTYMELPASLLIIIAVAMFFIGGTGLMVAIEKSKYAWRCFVFLSFIIVLTWITGLSVGIHYKNKLNPHLERNMNELFQKYDGESAQSSTVDSIQERLQCCGLKNYTYWENSTWHIQHNNSVPHSCCKNNATTCTGSLDHLEQINTRGCESDLERDVHKLLGNVMYIILGFGAVEVSSLHITILLRILEDIYY